MRKLEMLSDLSDATVAEVPCMTRRAILATLAAAALTACSASGTSTLTSDDAGFPDDDSGAPGDDASTTRDSSADTGAGDTGTGTCPAAATSAGPLSNYPQGRWKANGAYIVGHDANGLFAFSTNCTHQGCALNPPSPTTGATSCPCHGARFDGNGAVTAGPALTPLPHFELTLCNGTVYVNMRKTVVASTRTAAV